MKSITTGTENFKEFIDNNYYYVDKSEFIQIVLSDKITWCTRPRRFGKTLNMSMLYYFFSNKEKDNAYLFDGLKITKNKDILRYQNQYPVISISLKDMKRMTMEQQTEKFASIISHIINQNIELLDSPYIGDNDKKKIEDYLNENKSLSQLQDALYNISQCLYKHYQKKVIILIDEYDVPLQNAYFRGYYDEMSNFLSNVFSSALKTNDALERAVLTGCLRIAKESIFTGLNNFTVFSIFDQASSESFGFTQEEIDELLKYYHLEEHREKIKKWYDGYLFGDKEIYNPWSTLNYIKKLLVSSTSLPESFWANMSGNGIVYDYISQGDEALKNEFEVLISGNTVNKYIREELTYREMDDINNIYSFLLFTGYLKVKDHVYDEEENIKYNEYQLVIPNKEIKEIYKQSFIQYFDEYTRDRKKDLLGYLRDGNEDKADELLNDILSISVSYYDNYEAFYHGFLVGLFSGVNVESNKESGSGRFDLTILSRNIRETVVVIECKHSKIMSDLLKDSQYAASQIVDKKYIDGFKAMNYRKVEGYGIAFYKKSCIVTKV